MLIHEITLEDCVAILDIDGTLVASAKSAEAITQRTHEWVYQLKLKNRVYLCSNKKVHERNSAVADALGVGYLNSTHRKPSRKALAGLCADRPLVVIGDKFLTDGLFAKNIGARFIKVDRMVCADDTYYDRFHHAVDDIAYFVFKLFSR